MTETNPFRFFIPAFPRTLILGSFPCRRLGSYGNWYYSGSGRNHFWPLVSEVFSMPAATRDEKETLCEKHGIALSDIAWKIERVKGTCSDANLRIIGYNSEGISTCLRSGVRRVLCTSRFVESNFRRLFPDNALPVALLPSPSPAASKHIGGLEEYKKMKAAGKVDSTYAYRLIKYRELLAPL